MKHWIVAFFTALIATASLPAWGQTVPESSTSVLDTMVVTAGRVEEKKEAVTKSFFDKHNPWAQQSMAARMLETDRKNYWKAPEEVKKIWAEPMP